jgi:hypothetical protein
MENRFTKKYLSWMTQVRSARIAFDKSQSDENRKRLEDLKSVKWSKRAKYNRSYIKSGDLQRSIDLNKMFYTQLDNWLIKFTS